MVPIAAATVGPKPLIPFPLPLEFNLYSLRAVIRCCDFLEPRMLQRLLRRDALSRVVNEDAAKEVKEVPAKVIVARYYILELVSNACKPEQYIILPVVSSLP